jgi:hypothetical protein
VQSQALDIEPEAHVAKASNSFGTSFAMCCVCVQVLSANSESPLNCECLMEDIDFHSELSR